MLLQLLLNQRPPSPGLLRRSGWPRATATADEELRVVCVSDTHGFEDQLPPLPEGDLLIHCGDFAPDGSERARAAALRRFDEWLADQPHEVKIVVRGNHDPRYVTFPLSNAVYASQPTTTVVRSVVVHSVPFQRGRLREPLPTCDILATHSPPLYLLDKCYSGGFGGSKQLRGAVEDALVRPRLWLCGHIHEGRGHAPDAFGGGSAIVAPRNGPLELSVSPTAPGTLVVNCATANSGRAARLVSGAALVTWPLQPEAPSSTDARSDAADAYAPIAAEPRTTTAATAPAVLDAPFSPAVPDDGALRAVAATNDAGGSAVARTPAAARLLAVDLGLRGGVSLYDADGALLAYTSFHLPSAEELRREAEAMLRGTSTLLLGDGGDGGGDAVSSDEGPGAAAAVTHLVIEGGDVELREMWEQAVDATRAGSAGKESDSGDGGDGGDGGGGGGDGGIGEEPLRLMMVEPRAWRRVLLSGKERSSGQRAKAAARLIARQVVAERGVGPASWHEGRFNTDAAEAVLLGYYAVLELGWLSKNTPVRRYQNGEVILPKPPPTATAPPKVAEVSKRGRRRARAKF